MPSSLRPLTTGQLLDRTFQTYRQHFVIFAGIASVPQVCLLVIQLTTLAAVGTVKPTNTGAILVAALFGVATLIASIVVGAISTAATTFAVSDLHLEKPTTISSCFARVKGKVGRVIYTSIEYGLRVGFGFILLIVPGLYWSGKYGLAVPAVVLEDIKAKQAFKRSAELTQDSIGRIMTIYLLTWILVFVIGAGFGVLLVMVAPALSKAAGTVTSEAVQHILTAIINTVVTPVMSIALTLAYYDQRVRKEAFDIENMMSMLGEPVPPPQEKAAGTSA
jgi:multisubunit Na+/H+ antiporter MnhG subunit